MDEKELPSYLYKFRAFDESEYYKTFLEGKLYFASPKDFNDPMDTKILSNYEQGSFEQLREYFIKNFQFIGRMSYKEACKQVDLTIEERGIDKVKEYLPANETTFKMIEEDIGICSFAANNSNTKIWKEYADNNRGFCIEYDLQLLQEFLKELFSYRINNNFDPIFIAQVKYVQKLPLINPYDKDEANIIEQQLLTKTLQWNYEDEWRIINADGVGAKLRIPNDIITGVYFGSETNDLDIAKAKEIALRELGTLNFYKAIEKQNNGDFDFIELK